MSNLLFTEGTVVQDTALGTIFGNQLVTGNTKQETSQSCVVDLIAPTFSGISTLFRGTYGQLQATWSAGSDISLPLRYEVYVQANTATNLFNVANISYITSQLQADIFALGNGTLLQNGVTYYVGVRAIDAVGNRENNIVSLSTTTTGIIGSNAAEISGVFAVNTSNQLIASFWVTDNDGVIKNPVRLGDASYVIYDDSGNLVSGMSETNISADSEGFFEITPVISVLDLNNNYYTVKVTIPIDGMNVTYNLPITYPEAGPVYEPRAVFSINASNQLQGSIWCVKNGELLNTSLGVASFTIYDSQGNTIGITESSITADVNGYYEITPVIATAIQDLTHYVVKISIVADGVARIGSVGITLGE
jgi:hypothetical protein